MPLLLSLQRNTKVTGEMMKIKIGKDLVSFVLLMGPSIKDKPRTNSITEKEE
jgi:hypothetical protein